MPNQKKKKKLFLCINDTIVGITCWNEWRKVSKWYLRVSHSNGIRFSFNRFKFYSFFFFVPLLLSMTLFSWFFLQNGTRHSLHWTDKINMKRKLTINTIGISIRFEITADYWLIIIIIISFIFLYLFYFSRKHKLKNKNTTNPVKERTWMKVNIGNM